MSNQTDSNLTEAKLEPWYREPDPCWSCGGDAEARDDIHVRCIDSKGINCEVMNHWFTRKTWNSRVSAASAAPTVMAREIVAGCSNWHDIQCKIVPRITAALQSIEGSRQKQKDEDIAMTTVPHHPLCGKEIIPAAEHLAPQLTDLQLAYNQGIEDAMCAIRAESQGGGYWAATYINAIARRCSPFRYTGMPTEIDESTREQILQAITDIQEARESHAQWAAHLRTPHTFECQGCVDHAAHIGDADYHDEWIARYDNVIAVLARTSFTIAPASHVALQDEAESGDSTSS